MWLLTGNEGRTSPLAELLGAPDSSIHVNSGWVFAALGATALVVGRRGVLTMLRESVTYRPGEARWFAAWPRAALHGRFSRHEGAFDPGQRLANLVILLGLATLCLSGIGLAVVHGGPAFVWLLRIHKWATFVLVPVLVGHIIIASGALGGYRGVWRAMHSDGRVDIDVARRLWPGWTERHLSRIEEE